MPVSWTRRGAWLRQGLWAVLLMLPICPGPAWSAAGSDRECNAEWALSTRGVAIGVASDRVRTSADGAIRVFSDFHPNSLLAMFGVDPGTRELLLDGQGHAIARTETRGGSKPESNLWRRQEDGTWERSLNGRVDKHQPAVKGIVIDSTSFPYLLLLGLLPPTAASHTVTVVAKGKMYAAALQLQLLTGPVEAYAMDFSSTEGQGRAVMAADLHPLRIEFTDEHGTLRGQLRQWECR